jgi:NAD(P)-dependent dehydrogenase (short-subunit alcohol dehydrogenase family)
MTKWTSEDIPDLTGRSAVVTGANSGLGFQTSLQLVRHGARVVMAARDRGRGERAVRRVREMGPGANVELASLDVADLSSIRRFAERYGSQNEGLDVLVNNAGVMAIPYRHTVDGFEMQFGTNHLGHFALTGQLLPYLLARPGARVVTVSSTLHRKGRIDFEDLQGERSYRPWVAYAQSKLANLLFAFELQRHADAAGVDFLSVAAHPGYAATNLQAVGPHMTGSRLQAMLARVLNRVMAQSDAQGALPSLYAATAPDIVGGAYYGPDRLWESRGHPKRVTASRHAYDEEAARHLWQVSEELTGVRFDLFDQVPVATHS